MRTALSMSLAGEPDIHVIGDVADGGQAVELAGRLRPDVVIMDIRMPGIDGITATRRLTGDSRHKVLVMTTFDLDEYIVDALRAGASGFILKDATSAELVHAVRVVAAGDALLSPQVTRRLLDRYAHRLPPTTADPYSAILEGIYRTGTIRTQAGGAGIVQPGDRPAVAHGGEQREDTCVASAREVEPTGSRTAGHPRLRERVHTADRRAAAAGLTEGSIDPRAL